MIDPTAHIDPLWPPSPEDVAAVQPSLLDVGSPRLQRSAGGVLSFHQEGAPIPARAFDHRSAGEDVLTLSKSEVGTLRRCPRRYQYEYEMGRRPAAESLENAWGTALHRGLEGLYLAAKANMGDDALDLALTKAMTPAEGYTPPTDPFARAALRAMLRAYATVWGPDDARDYEVLHVELAFDLPVLTAAGRVSRNYRDGARREGRIDAVVRERCPNQEPCLEPECLRSRPVWLVEHKSTGKPPGEDRWYAGLELDLQTALYFDAATIIGLAPAGVLYDVVRRPDFDDPKPAPSMTKSGGPRRAPSEACGACGGSGRCSDEGPPDPCGVCSGTGRITKAVSYTNPRHGEPAAVYEERVYQLAISKPTDFFHRRALTIEPWQIEEAREDMRAAAAEVAWRRRTGHWPRVGDRYVCAAPRMVCPWLDVCGRRAVAEDDRLFPLKVKREEQGR